MEGAKIYAESAIRDKNQYLNCNKKQRTSNAFQLQGFSIAHT